jgi:CRP-like cAMP-binding protein
MTMHKLTELPNHHVNLDELLAELEPGALQAFRALQRPRFYPQGARVFAEGEAPSGVFVLANGTTRISVSGHQGDKLQSWTAEPGEILGLHAILSGAPYEATVESLTACEGFFISASDFLDFLCRHKGAAFRVVQLLSHQPDHLCEAALLR